ncbi:aldose 1-epimerase [Glaciimonas sp. PAMC28666]|uniref:aldose 1-epimerase n=1 Tax=Glaciimonas sp. PAMC28666 TaxID=2807626 RepID=UPI001962982A|nr:aldose 1-epimerase [Glaciimonas sp. PAMC28666]QRX82728.1 aldose 1-epimerase [Glaciimonas sp. PAMC28666]
MIKTRLSQPLTSVRMIELQSATQRLQVLPTLGGSIAAWDWKLGQQWSPLLRQWDGKSKDRYAMACFPLVPWSNRITEGGFMHQGQHYPVLENRPGEPYPIHGDGWLQKWRVASHTSDTIQLTLKSNRFDGNPHSYRCSQTLTLSDNGLSITLAVTHLGTESLPYGLGLHPYFPRNAETRFSSRAEGVWLSGHDPIPTAHTRCFPQTWNYNQPAPLEGPMIDNCFSGWDGKALISYPDRGLQLSMTMDNCSSYSLMYRPPGHDYFCFEPITHPIDAFHISGKPGLVTLARGQTLLMKTHFRVSAM